MLPFERTVHKRRISDIMQEEGMMGGAGGGPLSAAVVNRGRSGNDAGHGNNIFDHVQGEDGIESVPTGMNFITDQISRWIRNPSTLRRDVAGLLGFPVNVAADAKALADRVKTADDHAARTDVGRDLGNALREFENQFILFELDGSFNVDANGDSMSANTGGTFFSTSFIDSMRTRVEYHALPNLSFISTGALIDLCRCPAVFVSSDEGLRAFVLGVSMFPVPAILNARRDWNDWYQANSTRQPIFGTDFRTKMGKLHLVYNEGVLIRRALMLVKSQFMSSPHMDPREREIMHDFFNMEYALWIDLVLDQHSHLRGNHLESLKRRARIFMRPADVVERCVYDVLRIESSSNAEESLKYEAQRQDLYYANLVHGAAVRVPLSDIWCAHNELEHSDRDTGKFFDVMWKSLRDVLKTSLGDRFAIGGGAAAAAAAAEQRRTSDFVDALVKSVRRMRDTKSLMKELWEQSQEFRVSDRVHMVEIQVLQRLKRDGIFPFMDRLPDSQVLGPRPRDGFMQNIHLCFYMRRLVRSLSCRVLFTEVVVQHHSKQRHSYPLHFNHSNPLHYSTAGRFS